MLHPEARLQPPIDDDDEDSLEYETADDDEPQVGHDARPTVAAHGPPHYVSFVISVHFTLYILTLFFSCIYNLTN
jgi:hypothetical protein